MPYTAPTSANLKARFPAFNGVDNSVVDQALAEAARMVDESWTEGDFALGRMLYAAHTMTLDGLGTTASVDTDMPANVRRYKAGDTEIERFADTVVDASGYGATSYGQRFAQLLRLNKGAGPLVL